VSSESIGQFEDAVRIERPATGGGVGHLGDGRVVFVRHSLPGELVNVEITEATAKFCRADAVCVIEASPDRVAAPCEYARPGGCGGCDLQHASPLAQKSWKTSIVAEHLRRIAGVEIDVAVSGTTSGAQGSRTRLRCAVDDDGRLCLRGARSHALVAIERCWIGNDVFDQAFTTSWLGAEEVELRAIGDGPAFAVVRRETHRGTIHEICSFAGEPLEPSTQSRVDVGGHVYSVGPRSFWQSHRDAPSILLEAVLASADVAPGDHVTDLFSGVGLFAVPLAKLVGPGGRVSAVEASPYAVRDARQNGDGLRQLKVREWSVAPRAVNDSVAPGDVVVLDPPRNGLAKGVVDAMARRAPRRVTYVSCDAATFARDLKAFVGAGYELGKLQVFDLFPMTEHVEIVATLDIGL
jgi:tRNA/tmRNA/rRNA uracil-C5-methylase (TrmA/RlmC/RlmD family)